MANFHVSEALSFEKQSNHELTSLSFVHVRGRLNASKAASTEA